MESWLKPRPLLSALLIGLTAAVFAGRPGLAAINSADEITLAQSQMIERFFGLERNENGYLPQWLLAVEMDHNGEWQTDPPPLAFHVSAAQEENTGVLSLKVDRSALAGEDLVLALTFADDQEKGSLFIGLSSWPEGSATGEETFPADLFGDIMQGQGGTVTEYFEIPIQSFAAQYLSVDIHRGQGEVTISGAVLCTRTEFNYWLERALVQDAVPDVVSASQESAALAGADLAGGTSLTPKPSAVGRPAHQSAAPVVLPAEQIAAAAQLAANYMITRSVLISRSVLDSGGTRQTSTNFILEASIGQPSAIGFSFRGVLSVRGGYQQADDEQLEIWNVDVIPSVFNPTLGELTALSYVLSTRATNVTVELTNNVTTVVLVDNEPQGPGLHTVSWDGKLLNGNDVDQGWWTLRIRAADYQNRVITNEQARVNIWDAIPVIHSLSDAPDPFCPDTGGTAIAYTTVDPKNKKLNVSIDIEDAFGNPVTNFSALNQTPGTYSYNWDGTGARNGLYIYRVNASRPGEALGKAANEKTGSIILACNPKCVTNQEGNVEVCYQPGNFSITITSAAPDQISESSRAVLTAEPGLLFQAGIYDISADPSTSFDPPAILIFKYEPAITGDIDAKLDLRCYDPATTNWAIVSPQFIDYSNHRTIAEISNLSLYALFAPEQPAASAALMASVRLAPEVLSVNPGILTAYVSLPEGYPVRNITTATCDGALYEQMRLSKDETEMIIEFRRQAIAAALAQIGETIDIYFVIRGTWQDAAGVSYPFEGADSITKIVGGN